MDISLPQGNATIVAFISGDASFYTSTGGALSAESGTKKSGTPPVISSFPQRNTWIKWMLQPLIPCRAGKSAFYVLTPSGILRTRPMK